MIRLKQSAKLRFGAVVGGATVIACAICCGVSAAAAAPRSPSTLRRLYAVNEALGQLGSISVYDIDAGNRLIKTIRTVGDVLDVRGVAASAVTRRLYVAYVDQSGAGRIYCLDIDNDRILWDEAVAPGVDRLAIDPNGRFLYVPTGEHGTADFINVIGAGTGKGVRRVYFSSRSHDAQYPLSGPLFQETKAQDGSGKYLYSINTHDWAVSRIGPYSGVLGPYAVDGASRYVVSNVTDLWGMQVADLATGHIVTARLPAPAPRSVALPHGIGWTPDEKEVWENSTGADRHVYVWDMRKPMSPVLEAKLPLHGRDAGHWLTFTVKGDYAYVAPPKGSSSGTEIFDVRRKSPVGLIGSSEDMLEIDFVNGKVSRVGDQYGIGRVR